LADHFGSWELWAAMLGVLRRLSQQNGGSPFVKIRVRVWIYS
jgi:hypothetical protein